jgi:hypothetical protein
MFITKINITGIVRDHLRTLVHDHSGQPSLQDYVLFYAFPLLAASALIWYKGTFGKGIGGVLVTSFSVFAALLFNLLLLIYDIVRKADGTMPSLKSKFLKQIYSNISYSIFIAIMIIILLLGYFVALSFSRTSPRLILAFAVYCLSANFVLTILMILKRVHNLLSTEFENVSSKPREIRPSRNTKTA